MNKELDDDFIEVLMVSLQDERVIEKIKEIAVSGSFSQMREHKELLREKEKEIAKLKQEIELKKEEISEYQLKIHHQNEKIESYFNELQKRRADYREAEELYEAVQQLSATAKNSKESSRAKRYRNLLSVVYNMKTFHLCGILLKMKLWKEGSRKERFCSLFFSFSFMNIAKYTIPLYIKYRK